MIRESIGTSAHNDPDNYLLLGIAAAQGNLNLVDALLNAGAEVNPKAGYSKFALWHNDGTKDGKGINASTGREG